MTLPPLPRVGPICYAMVADIQEYKIPHVGNYLPGVYDIGLWSTDQLIAFGEACWNAALDEYHKTDVRKKSANNQRSRHVTTAAELRRQAKSDMSCVGAFARARPGKT